MASKKQESDDFLKTARTTSSKKKPTASNRAFFSSSTPKHSRQGKVHKQNNPSFTIAKEINSRIIASGKNHDWKGILEIYEKEMEHFSFINYATAMSQLGRIRSLRRDDARLEKLMIDVAMQLESPRNDGSWDARQMANVLHAVAKMGVKSNGATKCINSILNEENIQVMVENGTPQAIASTAWSCATLGIECPTLFKFIDANASSIIENGKPQDMSNTAWACAALGVECPTLFQLVDANASKLLENGTPQAIANTAWACATLGVECPTLFQLIEANASYLVENGTSQNIANTSWACATLGVDCPTLFKFIDANASSIVENGNPQDMSSTAWACATLGVECPTLFQLVDANASKFVENGTPQDIANTAWAFATLTVQCPTLFRLIDANASYLVEKGTSQALANTAWACATFGVQCPTLFDAIDSRMLTFLKLENSQAISTLCYSFAILDLAKEYEVMFRILWGSAIKINPSELSVQSCLQLLQTFVMVSQMLDIPPPNDDIQKLFVSLEKAPIESRSQREMSQLLVKLGFPHNVEVSPFQDHAFAVPSSLLAIDAACRERMIAIEFDGPSHFLKDNTKMGKVSEGVLVENGPTKAKRRLLERLGWTVVNIRYWEWDSAMTESEKMMLLSGKLSAA